MNDVRKQVKLNSFFILIFCSLILIPVVFSLKVDIDNVIFNETFNYTDVFANHGWAHTESDACMPTSPFNDSVNTGYGGTGGCAGGGWRRLRRRISNLTYNISDTVGVVIEFDYYLNHTTSIDWLGFSYEYVDGINDLHLELDSDAGGGNATLITERGGDSVCDFDFTMGTEYHHFIIHLKPSTDTVDLYLDGTRVCNNADGLGTSYVDIGYITFTQFFAATPTTQLLDNLLFSDGSVDVGAGECVYPLIFCDTFDYINSLYNEKEWIIYNQDNSLNTNFAPVDNLVKWNNTEPKSIGHEISRFETTYPIGEGINITQTLLAPVFSNEFVINFLNNTNHEMDFKVFDLNYELCWTVRFERNNINNSINVSFYNESDAWDILGYITPDNEHTVKIISKFMDINKSYPFNTSYTSNFIEIFIDGGAYHLNHNMDFNSECMNIFFPNFVKENFNSNISIDDYFMYVGTDKYIDTIPYYFIPLYEPEIEEEETIATGDLKDAIDSTWGDMGLLTQASKIIMSLMMIIIVSLVILGVCIKYHFPHPVSAIVIVDVLLMILLVYLGLMPIWIIIVLVLISAGLGALYLKSHIT